MSLARVVSIFSVPLAASRSLGFGLGLFDHPGKKKRISIEKTVVSVAQIRMIDAATFRVHVPYYK
jgi:hypothetical protein